MFYRPTPTFCSFSSLSHFNRCTLFQSQILIQSTWLINDYYIHRPRYMHEYITLKSPIIHRYASLRSLKITALNVSPYKLFQSPLDACLCLGERVLISIISFIHSFIHQSNTYCGILYARNYCKTFLTGFGFYDGRQTI